MAQTIPDPTEHMVRNAEFALTQWVERNNVVLNGPAFGEMVAVMAAKDAETTWLRGMIHDPSGLQEFLATTQPQTR